MIIPCLLQGTLYDTGIPHTFYGENICTVPLIEVLYFDSLILLFSLNLFLEARAEILENILLVFFGDLKTTKRDLEINSPSNSSNYVYGNMQRLGNIFLKQQKIILAHLI